MQNSGNPLLFQLSGIQQMLQQTSLTSPHLLIIKSWEDDQVH